MENRIIGGYTLMVKAQKADPQAVIVKGQRGGFDTTIINVMEDGSERKYKVSFDRKKDLVARLQNLPKDNVKGMGYSQDGFISIEIFAYNGV